MSRSQSKRSVKSQHRQTKKKRETQRNQKQSNKQVANRALKMFFDSESDIFSEYLFHRNIKWAATALAKMAVLLSLSEKPNITDAFKEMHRRSTHLSLPIHHSTYQGFMGALTNYVHVFIPVMILQLQRLMKKAGGRFWEIGGYVPIAFDGSRNSTSRTASNELEFCSALGKRKAAESPSTVSDPKPQIWITMMWHMGLRLPWDWRLGPSDSSEREHVQEMVQAASFPENTIFCGDAGFVGYEFWKTIIDQGYQFVVRVGSNVRLLECDTQGYVLSWPKRKQKHQAPLRLRLVKVRIGKADVYLLTSVLSERDLDASTMAELYKKRWGVEIAFRGLKQTLGGQKLRCRNADRAVTELHWSILAMAISELLAVKEQIAKSTPDSSYSPEDRSLANTMRAIYQCLDHLLESVIESDDLFSQLAAAVTDSYKRKSSKKARYRPKVDEKRKKKIKAPKVRQLEPHEIENLNKFDTKLAS